jgi:DNA-binding NtrC family response regulator
VRELRHVLERAVMGSAAASIDATDLPAEIVSPERVARGVLPVRPTLAQLEQQYIEFTLRETRGNQSKAAALLGISRKSLWEKRRRYERRPTSNGR